MASLTDMQPADLALSDRDVHIWEVDLNGSFPTDMIHHLSIEEQERAFKFRFEKDRKRWTVSRVAMRKILSRYLAISAHEIKFDYTSFGKPYFTGSKIIFNLTHSGDKALLAVSLISDVGIDIEMKKDIDFKRLIPRFFSEAEATAVMQSNDLQMSSSFYRVWTRKEAFIKAVGGGLSMPLKEFTVSTQMNNPVWIERIDWAPQQTADWTLITLNRYPNYEAALAVRSIDIHCQYFHFKNIELSDNQ